MLPVPTLNQMPSFVHSGLRPETGLLPSYVEHQPIAISSDQDFDDQLWPGNGTEDQPYLIENLNITDNGYNIKIENTRKHFIIRNCYLTANFNTGVGVEIINVTFAKVSNCYIERRQTGIFFQETINSVIEDNVMSDFSSQGIALIKSHDNYIFNNTLSNIDSNGIYIYNSTGVTASQNRISDTTTNGIYVSDASIFCQALNNTITNAGANGITSEANYFIATYNTVTITTWGGIIVYGSEGSNISLNTISYTGGYGIWVAYSSYTDMFCNNLYHTGGIALDYSSDNSEISNNNILSSFWNGICLFNSDNCTITANMISSPEANGIQIHGNSMHTSVFTNTITNAAWTGVCFDYASHGNISENIITSPQAFGIQCWNQSDFTQIHSNSIYDSVSNGIDVENSDFIYISCNMISNSSFHGISVRFSNAPRIMENSITVVESIGIEIIDCLSGVIIQSNYLNEMKLYGLKISGSPRSYIVGNYVKAATSYLFWIVNSQDSEIYLNGFIDNVTDCACIAGSPRCSWSNGTHGNYWGAYDGIDEDKNGIGDTPYIIDDYNQDPYPLVDYGSIEGYTLASEEIVKIINLARVPENPSAGQSITITFQVDNPSRVVGVILRYSVDGGVTWIEVEMTSNGNNWTAVIPPQNAGTTIFYQAVVHDIGGTWVSSSIQTVVIPNNTLFLGLDIITLVTISLFVVIVAVVSKVAYEMKKRRDRMKWESRF